MDIEEEAAEHVCEDCPFIRHVPDGEIDPGYDYCETGGEADPADKRCPNNKWYDAIIAAWEGDY